MQASRIADCLQRFGVNTFSKLDLNGYPWSWGGSQGNYDATTTARAINYITAGSGLTINDREYHRDSGGSPAVAMTPLQLTWIKEVYRATGSPFSIAIAAYGGAGDIPGIVSLVQDSATSGLNYVKWVEGINEPNNFGPISSDTSAVVQASLYQQIHAITTNVNVIGPSIVFGLPFPDGWISGYLDTNLETVLTNSDANNLHVYSPNSPNTSDGSTRDGVLADVDIAFKTVLPGKPAICTEWHPTLYSNAHNCDPAYDAYWGPIFLLSSYCDFNWQACFWFSVFDYDSVSMRSGLFATSDADPKPAAKAFRVLFKLTGDTGANKLTFTPGKLDVTVSGLPAATEGSPYAGGRSALFQNSAQQYFLLIWNEQNVISTTTRPVTVSFNSHNMCKVEEFNITSGSETPLQILTNVQTATVNLDTSLRLLRITYNSPIDAWRASNFSPSELNDPSISGDSANPSGDGIPNLTKYAFNLDPHEAVSSAGLTATSHSIDGMRTLSLTHRKNRFATDITYDYGISSELINWTTNGISPPTVVSIDAQTDLTTVSASSTNSDLFLKVKVIR